MTTTAPTDAIGTPLHTARSVPRADSWTAWSAHIEARMKAQRATVQALVESLRTQLRQRDRRIEALERDVAALRTELDTQARLVDMQARLDRLEAPRGSAGLRLASS